MSEGKLWSDINLLMLIRISREMLPELSNFWGRSLDEVERKYELIQEIFKSLYKVKAKKYLEMGFEPDEAFEKVASEEKINIERIREMEKSLAGAQ